MIMPNTELKEQLISDSGDKTPLLQSYGSTTFTDRLQSNTKPNPETEVVVEIDSSHGKTTNLQTLMHLLKGNIGPGILAMPTAFKNGGLWFSFAAVITIGMICTHCMHQLSYCSVILCKRNKVQTLGYGEVMEKCFETGPLRLRKFSSAARKLVNGFVIFTQFGFCCVYIVFVSENIKQVVDRFQPDNLSEELYIILTAICCLIYSVIRSLRTLAAFSAFANLLNLIGLIIVFVYLFVDLEDIGERPAVGSLEGFPIAFGQMVYAFEGIGLILPIQNKMKDRESFGGWCGLLTLQQVITVCLFTALGFYGYLEFGEETLGSITLNLPADQWIFLSPKVMFAVSVFITYGLQFYVPIGIIWTNMSQKFSSPNIVKYGEFALRIVMVLVTFLIALLVPNLDLLIGFVGAFASSSLALIMPPVIELVTFSVEESGITKWMWLKNLIIMLIGVVGFLTGTFTSLIDIIETFSL